MNLLHESTYTLDTNLSLLEVYENINALPSYFKMKYEQGLYTLTAYPYAMDQEEMEELAELISNKMNDRKLWGEIYDLIYEEDGVLNITFKH